MEKTTVYLPPELKEAVKQAAARRGTSEAEVIRQSIRGAVLSDRPRPRGALFESDELMAMRVDELLPGFGDR